MVCFQTNWMLLYKQRGKSQGAYSETCSKLLIHKSSVTSCAGLTNYFLNISVLQFVILFKTTLQQCLHSNITGRYIHFFNTTKNFWQILLNFHQQKHLAMRQTNLDTMLFCDNLLLWYVTAGFWIRTQEHRKVWPKTRLHRYVATTLEPAFKVP
jgi:hypothetical protein